VERLQYYIETKSMDKYVIYIYSLVTNEPNLLPMQISACVDEKIICYSLSIFSC